MYKELKLKTTSYEEFFNFCKAEGFVEDGHIVRIGSDYELLLGQRVYEDTGKTLSDSDGVMYKEKVLVDGYYATLLTSEDLILNVFSTLEDLSGKNKNTVASTTLTPTEIRQKSKQVREYLIESDIEVFGVFWQVDSEKDMPNIDDAIYEAEQSPVPPEYTIRWILADNTLRDTTLEDLKAIKSAKCLRKKKIFEDYTIWLSGDMSEVFKGGDY